MFQSKSLYALASAAVVFLSVTACSAASAHSSKTDGLAVDILSHSNASITQTVARQSGEGILVDGEVRRKAVGGRGIVKGHVDVTLNSSEGRVLGQTIAECDPWILPNRGTLTSSFSARLPLIAPPGSQVRLQFHNGPHEI
ncbi:MAG: hypothetical protein LBD10_06910 [Desulfobulbus sp.]|uniref:hypothetical protein n=1 Tax=Desulfobulbus sp. TaxID=895 RepID=UPI002841830C|nr:hypothetical protein [Desulfobulbus sp.]MDR2549909.1 hypothetical protein [Desulfobulbus sp.]